VAILYPTRATLADALRRLRRAKVPLDGAADHGVSEALYLHDPDGNGVELYRDRPPRNGRVPPTAAWRWVRNRSISTRCSRRPNNRPVLEWFKLKCGRERESSCERQRADGSSTRWRSQLHFF